ncbi:SDR family oxidoreductase [Xanthomonas floridensis]|uniref:NAD-dependent dehydratase n=1 Tax=Xanthomonas floridensis TaxID=1843580 RepID=A0A1A9MC20_9XANT|nr:SDR family oxidoreductase [Xanthomonas floridensis]MEA5126148.1 SDR family oxidoreductase [Xanthomonas floridensis]MEA5134046.1 SDR family oxidoreductase [Xanthomonas floridensis]OAG67140.1 NAD-dependent dehydratase [Xanthomonas floridensis]
MRIFVTGATGFIGTAVVADLLHAGHHVIGLARSDTAAATLLAAGAQVQRGTLEDLGTLRQAAAQADAVIHTAFNHDFSQFVANCEADRRVIDVLGSALAGSQRPLVTTSTTGTANATAGEPALETNPIASSSVLPRAASEEAAESLLQRGVNVSVVRLPQVHDQIKQGLVSHLIELARATGRSAFVGDGSNRWPATHLLDAARLYTLAAETGNAGSKYHAVAEQGVPLREIAEAIGRGVNVPVAALPPEQAQAHFGWLTRFAMHDLPASGTQTQQRLGWHPTGPGLLADLALMRN